MINSIVFDSGPIISLTMNNLLPVLKRLKEGFDGAFYITAGIKKELVDRPLQTKKFKFEALQVLRYIEQGVIEVLDNPKVKEPAAEMLSIANQCFKARGHWLTLFHYGEMSGIAACKFLGSNVFVVDERSARLLIEAPDRLIKVLEKTMHTEIEVDRENLNKISEFTKDIQLLRSAELATRAYELGMLDDYVLKVPEPKQTLLDAILWGVKLNGCAISRGEIDTVLEFEKRQR